MVTFGISETRTKFSKLVERANRGEIIEITRRGKPVAKLVPIQSRDVEKARKAAEEIRNLRKRLPANALKGLTIKQLIEEGRR